MKAETKQPKDNILSEKVMEDVIGSIRESISSKDEKKATEALDAFIEMLDAATPSRTRTLVLEFRELGGSQLLHEFFQEYSQDGPASKSACLLVSVISATSSASTSDKGGAVKELDDAGTLPDVLRLFHALVGDPETTAEYQGTLKACLIAISSVSSCRIGAGVLCRDPHCLGCVLRLLGSCADAVGLAHCMNVLANAAYLARDRAIERLGRGGAPAVGPAVSAMQRFPEDAKLCVLGLQALSYLAHGEGSDGGEVLGSLRAAGGVEAAINGMRFCAESEGVQRWGCNLLGLLAVNEGARRRIVEDNGIWTVVAALAGHSEAAAVLNNGLKALAVIAFRNEAYAAAVAGCRAGYVLSDCVPHALGAFPDNAELLGSACFAVYSLAETLPAVVQRRNSPACRWLDLFDSVARALRAFPESPRVQDYASAALRAIYTAACLEARRSGGDGEPGDKEMQRKLYARRPLDAVAAALTRTQEYAKPQTSAARALLEFLDDGSGLVGSAAELELKRLHKAGVPEALAAAMAKFPDNRDLRLAGCKLLALLAKVRENAERMPAAAIAAVVTTMKAAIAGMRPEDAEFQTLGCLFLVAVTNKIDANNAVVADLDGAQGVIAALTAALDANASASATAGKWSRESVELLASCCKCLANIAHTPGSRRSILEHRGIEALKALFRANKAKAAPSEDLALWSCTALAKTTSDSYLSRRILADGGRGIALLVPVVRGESSSSSSSSSSSTAKATRYFACLALGNACSAAPLAVRTDAVDAILAFLREDHSEKAQEAGLRALAYAVRESKKCAVHACKAGSAAIEGVVLPALRHFKKALPIQEWGLRAIAALLAHAAENRALWPAGAKGSEVLLTELEWLLRQRPLPAAVIARVLEALTAAVSGGSPSDEGDENAREKRNARELVEKNKGWAKLVVQALSAAPLAENAGAQKWGCALLCSLLVHSGEAAALAVAQAKGVDALLEVAAGAAAAAASRDYADVLEPALLALLLLLVVQKDAGAAMSKKRDAVAKVAKDAAAAGRYPGSLVVKYVGEHIADAAGALKGGNALVECSYSPFKFVTELPKMGVRDVVEWIEELCLDDQGTIEIVKRYKINGLVLSKLDKDDDLCNFGVEPREATEIFRALQELKQERARVVESFSSSIPESSSSLPLGDPPKKSSSDKEEEEEGSAIPNDGFLFRAVFEKKEKDDDKEIIQPGSSITWTDAVVASFNEKETLCYIVNIKNEKKEKEESEDGDGRMVLYEIRGDFGKLGALNSPSGANEGARVIPPGTKFNVVSVAPDCYFPNVTRAIIEIC